MEIINGERLVLGTCYYPEHWDESLWRDDLKRMLENGIEVIRRICMEQDRAVRRCIQL